MHYGDKIQLEKAEMLLVVYKHEVLYNKFKRNKNGRVSKRSVHYEIASVHSIKFFNTQVIKSIFNDPYKYFSKYLDDFPLEEWILVRVTDINGYGKIRVEPISIVSTHPDELYRLH